MIEKESDTMKIEYIFLELFTSFVRQTAPPKVEDLAEDEWNRLMSISAYHQVIPIIYESAWKMDGFKSCPPVLAGAWRRETMKSVANQARMTDEFLALYDGLGRMGVHPLVVKGLVCRNLYPKPDYRMSGDEDLLIRREDFHKVDQYLLDKGFQRNETNEELEQKLNTIQEIGYCNPMTRVYLEIHLDLFPEESGAYGHFNRMFEGLHEKAVCLDINGRQVWTLHPTEHFLYLLAHSAKHFLHSGFGVRQVFDLILFAENYGKQLDWKKIIEKTKENRIYTFLVNLLDIGVKYMQFHPEKACWPLDEQELDGSLDSKELLEDLLVAGIYGASTDERLHSSNITLAAADEENHAGGLMASLFPDKAYIGQKYSYVKEHPWLLPVGWVHRIIEYIRKKGIDNRQVLELGNQRVQMLKKYGMIVEKERK